MWCAPGDLAWIVVAAVCWLVIRRQDRVDQPIRTSAWPGMFRSLLRVRRRSASSLWQTSGIRRKAVMLLHRLARSSRSAGSS
ncbi:hypothetical protein D3C87_2122330 [compost metagenome]